MIHDFDIWAAERAETNSLTELENTTVAIEASFYLDRLLNQASNREPLLPALAGQPLQIQLTIQNELDVFHSLNIKPLFVFDGIHVGSNSLPFRRSDEAARLNAEAWELYNQHLAEQAVSAFRKRNVPPEDCHRLLQSTVHARGLPFLVAPYSALGQMVYLSKQNNEFIQALAGPSDLLLYDIDKLITDLDFQNKEFTWVRRQAWIDDLGVSSPDQFVDACLLSGCEMLEPLPILTQSVSNRKIQHLPQVLELMKNNTVKSGYAVCKQAQEDPAMRQTDYLDRYRRRRLAVKHQVVVNSDGKAEPFDPELVPSDLHEVIGQRLPDELYYYLSRGTIGPRILNQLTSQQIFEPAPPDGGDSEEYRNLVLDRLTPMRATSLSLLAHSLTRAYQHHNIKLQCWFDPSREVIIRMGEVVNQGPAVASWAVPEEVFKQLLPPSQSDVVSIATAINLLSQQKFSAETLEKSRSEVPRMRTALEVQANTLWRFLQLRNYVNEKHELTPWGQVLHAIFSHTQQMLPGQDEAMMLAVELLRLDLLSSSSLSITTSGAPIHGSETDKKNCLLVSRIASLGTLQHDAIGYTGPLSRNLLAYNSMSEAVRKILRDLEEVTLVTLLLNGDADREALDLTRIGLTLPFLLPQNCSLGIAMKHYLDELAALDATKLSEGKETLKEKGPRDWFPHSIDFRGDLEKAFSMWDAIYNGVLKAAELELVNAKDKEGWQAVDAWVQERR